MMSITSLARVEVGLATLRSQYNQAAGQKSLLERQQAEKQGALDRARTDIEVWAQVQALFGKASEYARTQLKTKLEQTVTAALQAVFGVETIRFEVEMKATNGQPSATWQIVSDIGDVPVTASPEDAHGGGIVDVVSLALRLALLELARPKIEGPIIFDEPAKMVSAEYLPNLAAFLKQYAKATNRQILMVTHAPTLAEIADVSYWVTQKDGISRVGMGDVWKGEVNNNAQQSDLS